MTLDHEVFDRSVVFHRFCWEWTMFYSAQLVCVSAIRNSWDGSSVRGRTSGQDEEGVYSES